MPKDRANKRRVHESSVKLNRRQFAVQNHAQHIEIGSAVGSSGLAILESYAIPEDPSSVALTKKEKQQSKKEAFLQRWESPLLHSRSHSRRLRRKAKEQIVGGDLKDLQTAIATIDDDSKARGSHGHAYEDIDGRTPSLGKSTLNPRPKPGKIGEGKPNPLSKSQRKRALATEQLRQPLILSNPEFALNPFQTLRTHAQNTLSKHHASAQ